MDKNFFKVWGGISGVQHTLPLLLSSRRRGDESHSRPVGKVRNMESSQRLLTSSPTSELSLSHIANWLSANVARRFNIPSKGEIAVGYDAEFALVDLQQSFTVAKADLFYRHRQSPYVGRALTGRVVQTILRGQTIFKDGNIVASPAGRLIKPQR